MAETRTMVDPNISDLFFNTELDNCKLKDAKGNFEGWDESKLKQEAQDFLSCLDRLGVITPSIEDLIGDFYDRV